MTNDKQPPKNFSQLFEPFFQKSYGWFVNLNKYLKATLLFLVLIILFFSARVGIFGEGFQTLTFVILRIPVLPTDKKWIDSPPTTNQSAAEKNKAAGKSDNTTADSTAQPNPSTSLPDPGKKDIKGELPVSRIAVNLNFTVNDSQGQIGKTYSSGDNVTLFFRTDQDCYLLLICVDKNRVTSLLGEKPEPQYIKAGATDESISFVLDQVSREPPHLDEAAVVGNDAVIPVDHQDAVNRGFLLRGQ